MDPAAAGGSGGPPTSSGIIVNGANHTPYKLDAGSYYELTDYSGSVHRIPISSTSVTLQAGQQIQSPLSGHKLQVKQVQAY